MNSKDKFLMFLSLVSLPFSQMVAEEGKNLVTSPIIQEVQQNVKANGRVTDASGEAIIGASVLEKGTTNGTITDMDGNFTLNVKPNARLVVSFIGYITQEVAVGTALNIVLKEDSKTLDEVVVVGYGSQKKVTLTGAISSIQSDDILNTKNENVANMLSGKVAGFRVVQRTSEPGKLDATFDIRGLGTPLIVIDGAPSDASDLARLNGNEIENLTVLKDASAAVYGVRAANGVVLVTTKKGNSGKAKFSYDGSFSIQVPTNEPDLLDAAGFMTLYNESVRNSALGTGTNNPYSAEEIAAYMNGTKQSYDWYGLAMNKVAPMHQHNLSASGGTEKVQYYVSLGYLAQEGLASSGIQEYQRWNLRSNLQAELLKGLKLNMNIAGMKDNSKGVAGGMNSIYKSMWRQLPINSPYVNDDSSMPFNGFDSVHPMVEINENLRGYAKSINGKFNATGSLTYDMPFVKGLSVKVLYNYEHRFVENRTFNKQFTLYNGDGTTVQSSNPTKLTRNYTPRNNSLSQLSLNYEKIFGNHSVKGLLLYEESKRESDNFWVAREFELDVLDELFAGMPSNITGNSDTGSVYTNVNRGLVGRANYSYMDKYLAEFSFRYDGSSKFMKGHQWGFFPAASIGWRVSEENFLKESSISNVVNNLKVRASLGKMGDDSSSSYQWLQGYNYPGTTNTVWNRNYVTGSSTIGIANPNITWYTSVMLDLGFDISLWNEKLGVSFDWYRRDRDGLLSTRAGAVPGVFGANFAQENLNSDMTTGFELIVSHRNQVGDFHYDLSGNVGFARSQYKHIERSDATDSRDNWLYNTNNRWSNLLWGYDYEGLFNSYQEAWNWASYASSMASNAGNQYILPGDIKVGDWNEDGVIDGNDLHVIGIMEGQSNNFRDNTHKPLWNFGFSGNMEYKGFDLNFLFQGTAGVWFLNPEKFETALPWSGQSNGLSRFMDRWHTADDTANPYDPNTEWISGKWFSTRSSNTINYSFNTLHNISKVWYLRLKSVELGYTFPKQWFDRTYIQKLRVYANGYNLLTFTNARDIDPERPTSGHGYVYPLMRTFTLGVNLTF